MSSKVKFFKVDTERYPSIAARYQVSGGRGGEGVGRAVGQSALRRTSRSAWERSRTPHSSAPPPVLFLLSLALQRCPR